MTADREALVAELGALDGDDERRRAARATTGGALFFSGALLTGLEVGPWFLAGLSVPGVAIMALGAAIMIRAHRRNSGA